MKLKREPALLIGLATAVLSLLVLKGLLTAEEAKAWGEIVAAIAPLAAGVLIRFFVMPTSTIEDSDHSVEEIKASAARNTVGD